MISKRSVSFFIIISLLSLIGDLVYRLYTNPTAFPWDLLIVIILISTAGLPLIISQVGSTEQTKILWGLLLGTMLGSAIKPIRLYMAGTPLSSSTVLFNVLGPLLVWACFAGIVTLVTRNRNNKPHSK